jgi:hypothetical protein
MTPFLHGQQTIQTAQHLHTPRKHIVPTHLNMPDQVLSVWSLSLSARQLLLLLVGAGIGGTIFQHLVILGHYGMPGEVLRLLLSLPPFLLALLVAWYQYAGRYLEVWLVVLLRYRLRPKCYLWRSIRYDEHQLSPPNQAGEKAGMEDVTHVDRAISEQRAVA